MTERGGRQPRRRLRFGGSSRAARAWASRICLKTLPVPGRIRSRLSASASRSRRRVRSCSRGSSSSSLTHAILPGVRLWRNRRTHWLRSCMATSDSARSRRRTTGMCRPCRRLPPGCSSGPCNRSFTRRCPGDRVPRAPSGRRRSSVVDPRARPCAGRSEPDAAGYGLARSAGAAMDTGEIDGRSPGGPATGRRADRCGMGEGREAPARATNVAARPGARTEARSGASRRDGDARRSDARRSDARRSYARARA